MYMDKPNLMKNVRKLQLFTIVAAALFMVSCSGETGIVCVNYVKEADAFSPYGPVSGLELTLAVPQGDGEKQKNVISAIKEIISHSSIAEEIGAPEGETLQAIADNYEERFKKGVASGDLDSPCIYHLHVLCQYSNSQCAVLHVSDGVYANGGPREYVWNVRLSDGKLMPFQELFTASGDDVKMLGLQYGNDELKEALNDGLFEDSWLAPDSAGCRVKIQRGSHFFSDFIVPQESVKPYLTDEGKKMFEIPEEEQSSQEETSTDQLPQLTNILSNYRELYLKGMDSRAIKREMRPIIKEAKTLEIPVTGAPYGISCSKAVIDDYVVNDDGINLIMRFVPAEGTSFNLDGPSMIGGKQYFGPYGKLVRASMKTPDSTLTSRICHCKGDGKDLFITMIIMYKNLEKWKRLTSIELSEYHQ